MQELLKEKLEFLFGGKLVGPSQVRERTQEDSIVYSVKIGKL